MPTARHSGGEFLVNTTTVASQLLPSVTALSDGGFVVAWGDNSGDPSLPAVRAQVFSADGTKSGDEFLVNTTTTGTQSEPTVTTLADGRIMFAFMDDSQTGGDTSSTAIRGQIFDPREEAVTLFGTVGGDDLVGTGFGDTMEGRAGNDTLAGANGDDILRGDAGDDELHGGMGEDVLEGGGDDDELSGDASHDTLRGEAGDDTIHGGTGNDLIDGGDGNDDLRGDAGSDKILGGAGNDLMIGGGGGDDMEGGTGDDFYSLDSLSDIVTELAGQGTDTISTQFFGIDLADYANVENVFLAGTGDFALTGSAAANALQGNEGDNVITGAGGADNLFGYTGADNFVFTALKELDGEGQGPRRHHRLQFKRARQDRPLGDRRQERRIGQRLHLHRHRQVPP